MDGLQAAGLVRAEDSDRRALERARGGDPGRVHGENRRAVGPARPCGASPWPTREAVPAGVYARAWLQSLGLWERLKDKVVPTLNVRAALAAVEAESADAGIVYRTDAAISRRVKVAFEVPREQGPTIVYPLAPIAASRKARHRRARPAPHLRAGARGLPALRLRRPPGAIASADGRGGSRRRLHAAAWRRSARCSSCRPGIAAALALARYRGPGKGVLETLLVAPARPAAHGGRAPPARAAGAPRPVGAWLARARHRGRLHVEGGGRGHGRHVVPAARALGAHGLRGGRSAPGRHRPHARLRCRRPRSSG